MSKKNEKKDEKDKKYKMEFVDSRYVVTEEIEENGVKKKRIITDLSKVPPEGIDLFKRVLEKMEEEKENDNNLMMLDNQDISIGNTFGSLYVIKEILKRKGILDAFGNDIQARLTALQICIRFLYDYRKSNIQKDELKYHAINEVLNIQEYDNEILYNNLDWISENQDIIEKKLFEISQKKEKNNKYYLYDLNITYYEDAKEKIAFFGGVSKSVKNEDKMNIIVYILFDNSGNPISIEVFDEKNFNKIILTNYINKIEKKFGIENLIIVSSATRIDKSSEAIKGKLKSSFITKVKKNEFDKLIKSKIIKPELFEEKLTEIEVKGIRYILKKDQKLAKKNHQNREYKIEWLIYRLQDFNDEINEDKKVNIRKCIDEIKKIIKNLKLSFIEVVYNKTTNKFKIIENIEMKKESEDIDGCFIIKSDVSKNELTTEEIFKKYNDVHLIISSYNTVNQTKERIGRFYNLNAEYIRGYTIVSVLSFIVMRELMDSIKIPKFSVSDLLNILLRVRFSRRITRGKNKVEKIISEPTEEVIPILKSLGIKYPENFEELRW